MKALKNQFPVSSLESSRRACLRLSCANKCERSSLHKFFYYYYFKFPASLHRVRRRCLRSGGYKHSSPARAHAPLSTHLLQRAVHLCGYAGSVDRRENREGGLLSIDRPSLTTACAYARCAANVRSKGEVATLKRERRH